MTLCCSHLIVRFPCLAWLNLLFFLIDLAPVFLIARVLFSKEEKEKLLSCFNIIPKIALTLDSQEKEKFLSKKKGKNKRNCSRMSSGGTLEAFPFVVFSRSPYPNTEAHSSHSASDHSSVQISELASYFSSALLLLRGQAVERNPPGPRQKLLLL